MSEQSMISDVTSFAATNADFWTELLNGSDLPKELTDEERAAIEAATEHIGEQVKALLHSCTQQLESKDKRLVAPSHRPAATKRNRFVVVSPPNGLQQQLYRLVFSLNHPTADGAREPVKLWPMLEAKKGSIPGILKDLRNEGIKCADSGYWVYSRGFELEQGTSIANRVRQKNLDWVKGLMGRCR